MRPKDKIAILLYDITLTGGAEHVAVNIANELIKKYDVSLISCFHSCSNEAFFVDKNIKKYVLSQDTCSMTIYSKKLSAKLKDILLNNKIDILLNITAGVNTVSYLATRNIATKVIYCEHSNLFNKTYGKKHELRQWIGAKTSNKVIALTEADQHQFEKKYNILGKVDYIYNWYNEGKSDKYNVASKKIISVGRLEYVKGYDRLIKVANSVLKKHKDWVWDIYGEGTYRAKIEKDIKDNKLENFVFLKGNCKNIMDLYKEYSFLVMTSYFEGLPMTLLEAKANLLPVVSFDCPTGPNEIIKNNFDGFIVQNGDCEAMSEAIERLIVDTELRSEFSINSTKVLYKFEKEVILNKWISTIDELLDQERNEKC